MTVVPHGLLGYLTAWPTGPSQPVVSTLNSLDGTVRAVAAFVAAGTSGAVSFFATNDTDLVHQALSLSELSQLKKHQAAVARLLGYLPPKLKGTFFLGASAEQQQFWIETFEMMRAGVKS